MNIPIDDIVADWAKVGTMLAVSHMLAGGNLQDPMWQQASLFTLLGFTAFHLSTRQLVDTTQFGEYKPIADDIVKVGTMMAVSRLLAGGDLTDQNWMMASGYTLAGFAAYNLVTSKFIQGSQIAPDCKGIALTIDDAAKFGTMFVVSQLLSGGSLQDPEWQMSSLYTMLGFAAFNLVIRNFL